MSRVHELLAQAWKLRWVFALVLVPIAALFGSAVVASLVIPGLSLDMLTRDPLAVTEGDRYLGALSNVGIVMWAMAAGACILAALALRRQARPGAAVSFFAWSAALTAVLGLDDLFQLHEWVQPRLPSGEVAVVVGYVVLVGIYAWQFRRSLLTAEYALIVAAGACFAASIAVDAVPDRLHPEALKPYFLPLEDGFKMLGIAFWLAFFLRAGTAALDPRAVDGPESPVGAPRPAA
jgi:hypothetical protein